eukprot:s540_g13.t1
MRSFAFRANGSRGFTNLRDGQAELKHISFAEVHLGSRRIEFQIPGTRSAMMSSRNADPDSPRAMAYRAEAVRSFLERHGFSDVNCPRDFDESVPHRIQMKPVFPIEVASDLGKEAMVNMLLDAGAITNPHSAPPSPSSATSKSRSFSFSFLCGSRQREEAVAASPQPQLAPLRSCLSDGSRTRLESSKSGTGRKEAISTTWV